MRKRFRWPAKCRRALQEFYGSTRKPTERYQKLFKWTGAEWIRFSHNPSIHTKIRMLELDYLESKGLHEPTLY